jgi:hypothetical protein
VAALDQRRDVQLSYFNRYSSVHFIPDPIGDIIFNGVASEVFRSDFANGVTGDIAYRLNEAHTLRAGLLLRTDKTQVPTPIRSNRSMLPAIRSMRRSRSSIRAV